MIGDTIKRFREQRGWTQEQLAEKMGYTSKSTINKIEKNINDVGQRKIIKFAEVFGCDVTELMCDIPKEVTVDSVNEQYDQEQIEHAINLYNIYQQASPEVRSAVELLLKSAKQDS